MKENLWTLLGISHGLFAVWLYFLSENFEYFSKIKIFNYSNNPPTLTLSLIIAFVIIFWVIFGIKFFENRKNFINPFSYPLLFVIIFVKLLCIFIIFPFIARIIINSSEILSFFGIMITYFVFWWLIFLVFFVDYKKFFKK